MPGNKRWTSKEIELLRRNYSDRTAERIGRELGRTTIAVRTRAMMLGLRKNQPRIRECHGCHKTAWIKSKNLCKQCYVRSWRRRICDLWNGQTRLANDDRHTAVQAEELATHILAYEGFKDIWHISKENRYLFCDYMAKKEAREYLIDVTIHAVKQPNTTLMRFADRTGFQVATLYVSPSKRRYYLMPRTKKLSIGTIQRAKTFPPYLL